jgi:hypothetical protein
MASDRWKESDVRSVRSDARSRSRAAGGAAESGAGIPDFVRRALSAGFSGFFLTGEALREALGDSMPREWADFASEQSARARSELIERLSVEMGRAVEGIDWAQVIATLLEGRTLEVRAEIRLGETQDDGRPSLHVKLAED